jgi:hypothetical protein
MPLTYDETDKIRLTALDDEGDEYKDDEDMDTEEEEDAGEEDDEKDM